MSNIIRKFNPDIINFCEIQGCDELNYLRDHTTSNYNSYMIQGTDTAMGQNVGMLTKLDPLSDLERSEEHNGCIWCVALLVLRMDSMVKDIPNHP